MNISDNRKHFRLKLTNQWLGLKVFKILYHHHHLIVPSARISLTLSGHPSLSFITAPYLHIAAVCRFELTALVLHRHMKGSIGVHHLWARPYFTSSLSSNSHILSCWLKFQSGRCIFWITNTWNCELKIKMMISILTVYIYIYIIVLVSVLHKKRDIKCCHLLAMLQRFTLFLMSIFENADPGFRYASYDYKFILSHLNIRHRINFDSRLTIGNLSTLMIFKIILSLSLSLYIYIYIYYSLELLAVKIHLRVYIYIYTPSHPSFPCLFWIILSTRSEEVLLFLVFLIHINTHNWMEINL